MALFGVDFYGAARYGPRIYLDFDASPLLASAVGGYNSLFVSWTTPAGQWSRLRLVRNAFGAPVDQGDGVVLLDSTSGPAEPIGTRAAAVRTFNDTNLEGGRFQYYAIWLYVPGSDEWTRAASAIGLPLKDYGYSDRLWELTPSILRTKTTGLLDGDNTELQTFESIFGYQLDGLRADVDTLRDANDPARVSGNLLPLMAQQWGQFFEPELGMKQMRNLLRDTVHLYRNKGTVPGIEGFISAVSGYGAKVQPLKNLILDYNDSSAEESVGQWFGDINGAATRYVADDIINSAPTALASTMRAVGIFKLTAYAAGSSRMRQQMLPYEPNSFGLGIPVTAGQNYVFSAYARSSAGVPAHASIFWLDRTGALISEAAGAAVTPVNDWSQRAVVTQAAPAGAIYACLGLTFTAAAAGNVVYFDALQFEAGTVPTSYEDARLIDINVLAPRVNLVTNPNFETDTGGWVPTSGATITRDTTRFHSGAASAKLVGSNATDTYVEIRPTVTPNTTYTASAWVFLPTGTVATDFFQSRDVFWLIDYAAGTHVVAEPYDITKLNQWQRVNATITTGPTSTDLALRFYGHAAGIGLDDVMLEAGVSLNDYFDGTTYAFLGDSIWEGTANESRSHYYSRRRTKNYRMQALLPTYTPMGSSFRLNYAQPL